MEKQCHKCKINIHKDASICPHCQSKQPSNSKNIFYLILIIIILAAFGRACSVDRPPTPPPAAVQEEALTEKGKKVKEKHAAWNNKICNTVANKEITIGMNEEQVRTAWGKPYKINSTIMAGRQRDQWVMHESGSTYLYFDNGILTTAQQPSK